MSSQLKSIFSNLPDEIIRSIYEMHNIHYTIHNNKLKYLHKQLLIAFTCENCDCVKDSYLFNAYYCSLTCYMQARDDHYTIKI